MQYNTIKILTRTTRISTTITSQAFIKSSLFSPSLFLAPSRSFSARFIVGNMASLHRSPSKLVQPFSPATSQSTITTASAPTPATDSKAIPIPIQTISTFNPSPIHPDTNSNLVQKREEDNTSTTTGSFSSILTPADSDTSAPQSSSPLSHLFSQNRAWASSVERNYPGFFSRLATQQSPKYLWIGCSDSRVPASEITGLMPGEVFVHRNVANCVLHSDLNVHSVIQLAVDIIKVEHIIVCGHYQCAGIQLALENKSVGLADHWIRNIKDVAVRYDSQLSGSSDLDAKKELLTELNVGQSVENVCFSSTVQNAWARGQKLTVHGWVYAVKNGLLKDLIMPPIDNIKQVHQLFHMNRGTNNTSIASNTNAQKQNKSFPETIEEKGEK